MNQAIRKTFNQQGARWLPKRPLGEENGNSKLIYALFILMIPQKDPRRTHTFLKELSLYIVVTMTRSCTRGGGAPIIILR